MPAVPRQWCVSGHMQRIDRRQWHLHHGSRWLSRGPLHRRRKSTDLRRAPRHNLERTESQEKDRQWRSKPATGSAWPKIASAKRDIRGKFRAANALDHCSGPCYSAGDGDRVVGSATRSHTITPQGQEPDLSVRLLFIPAPLLQDAKRPSGKEFIVKRPAVVG